MGNKGAKTPTQDGTPAEKRKTLTALLLALGIL